MSNLHRSAASDTSSICSDTAADIPDGRSEILITNGPFNSKIKSHFVKESDQSSNNLTKGIGKIPFPIRRKSKIEKEQEIQQVKLEAMNQVENTVKITDIIRERDHKINDLQLENRQLRKEIGNLKYQLDESKSLNQELTEQLRTENNSKTQRRIESENQRTRDLIDVTLSPNVGYDRYLKDIVQNRDFLQDQNTQLRAELDRSRDKIIVLQENIDYLESISSESSNVINDANVDQRSKSELLQLVRSNIDDKMIWMEYAIHLTQVAMKKYPDLLRVDIKPSQLKDSEEFCCQSEAKWESFAISLLKKVNDSNPHFAQSLINSIESIPSDLIRSKMKKKK